MRAIRGYFAGFHQMKYPLGALVALIIADGIISNFLVTSGLGREGNPFLQSLVGEQNFLIIKVVGALLCALILWDIYKRRPKMALISSLCFVGFYAVIVCWNLSLCFMNQW